MAPGSVLGCCPLRSWHGVEQQLLSGALGRPRLWLGAAEHGMALSGSSQAAGWALSSRAGGIG